MDREKRHNLLISGMGSASGGVFNNVRIDGMSKVNGDLSCVRFLCNGKADINGSVTADDSIEVNGLATIAGFLKAEHVVINGKATVRGDIVGERAELSGMPNITGNCEVETLTIKGGIRIDGLVNAETIDVRLYGHSRIREMGGKTISVRREPNDLSRFLAFLFPPFASKLSADSIEGDDIYLEYTQAGVVRGNNVRIGPGCDIELVEYRNKYEQSPEAKVTRHQQV
ncbi:cytoskeletal protein CcmA (bactofilin family) [Brevibacillus aydinogluensis]|uniref:polymer-forming cytoskeletal protein n=1 Tax=Brevibacillus aydinogluensis TaxID=927786 RepID=UPI002892E9E6|nr:polymer-forming cytoskeletal protein [Brevibacillus aydinogluensis]MDT3415058.1 cytoskeletal protein CcmA (bactofilin family) [Brevibacillus aydinogluensis]